jgi:predicted O-methyltransferase YrrM
MEHFYQNIGEDWFSYPNLYKRVIDTFKNNSHFVEIGTWKGRSISFMAVEIINSGYNIKLDCVDTWEGSPEHYETDAIKTYTLYHQFLQNTEPISYMLTHIRDYSVNASKLYEDESLDFIFIDAAHDYQNVKNDINAWFPKVKKGGIIAGHDYVKGWHDVVKAVDEFFEGQEFEKSEDCWIYTKI